MKRTNQVFILFTKLLGKCFKKLDHFKEKILSEWSNFFNTPHYIRIVKLTIDADPHGSHLRLNVASPQPDQPRHGLGPLPDALLEILPRGFHRLSPHGNVLFSLQPFLVRKLQRFISKRISHRFSAVEDIL